MGLGLPQLKSYCKPVIYYIRFESREIIADKLCKIQAMNASKENHSLIKGEKTFCCV